MKSTFNVLVLLFALCGSLLGQTMVAPRGGIDTPSLNHVVICDSHYKTITACIAASGLSGTVIIPAYQHVGETYVLNSASVMDFRAGQPLLMSPTFLNASATADPTGPLGLATKGYVDNQIAIVSNNMANAIAPTVSALVGSLVSADGSVAMTGPLTLPGDPVLSNQAATKHYIDTHSSAGGVWGTISGSIASQTDLNTALTAKASLNSPTFTGTVTLPADPVSALQAATKQYVDTHVDGYTEEHNYLVAGSYTFNHGLNTAWTLTTCINTNGSPLSPANYTIASIDANNTAIAVGSAQDLTCSFNAGAVLPPYFYVTVPSPGTYWPSIGGTQSVPFVVTQTIGRAYAGTVTYGASGLASGMSGSFSPATVTGAGTTTFNLTFPAMQPAGTTTFAVTGNDGTKSHSALISPSITIAGINNGLVEGWNMNEGSGTTFNGLVTGNNCTFSSGAGSWGTVTGFPGSTYTFNGTGTATCANNNATNFTGASDFTVSFWCNLTGANAYNRIVADFGSTGWILQTTGSGGIQYYLLSSGSQSHEFNSVPLIGTGKHYVVFVYKAPFTAGTGTIYIDGISQGTIAITGTGSFASSSPMYMSSSGYITGVLKAVRIYNRALSQAEVSSYFAAGVI